MGNGSSGLSKKSVGYEAYKRMSEQTKKLGYTLKKNKALADILNGEGLAAKLHQKHIQDQIDALQAYRDAMGNSIQIETNITYKSLTGGASANTNVYSEINVNTKFLSISDGDELVHEDTHNLVHSLITKELGFKKGTSEYFKAYMDGAIERDIQMEAYKKFYEEQFDTKWSSGNDPTSQQISRAAVELSGMRDYALHQYAWAPTGTYIEVPTVAAECFQRVNFDWSRLHREYPYAYHVMREIYNRLK